MSHVHVTKCKMDSGRKSGYYTTILTGKEDCCQCTCSLSTAKHFVTSLSQWCMQESLFASVSVRSCSDLCILRSNAKWLLALVRKEFTNCFPVLTLHRLLSFFFATQKGGWYPAFYLLSISHLVTWGIDVNYIRSIIPYPRSATAVSKSWNISGRVMASVLATLPSAGRSTIPGLRSEREDTTELEYTDTLVEHLNTHLNIYWM